MSVNKKYLVGGVVVAVGIIIVGSIWATYYITNNGWNISPKENHPASHTSQKKDTTLPDTYGDIYDIDFSRKAILYNQQAIEMSDIVSVRSTDESTKAWAKERSRNLTTKTEKYKSLLNEWGETYRDLASFPRSDTHDGYYSDTGFATAEDMQLLEAQTSETINDQYRKLMTIHHEGFLSLVETHGVHVTKKSTADLRDDSKKDYQNTLRDLRVLNQ